LSNLYLSEGPLPNFLAPDELPPVLLELLSHLYEVVYDRRISKPVTSALIERRYKWPI
jgi:hypothetical protein